MNVNKHNSRSVPKTAYRQTSKSSLWGEKKPRVNKTLMIKTHASGVQQAPERDTSPSGMGSGFYICYARLHVLVHGFAHTFSSCFPAALFTRQCH